MIKSQKVKLLLNTKVDKVVSKGSKIEKVILDNKKEIFHCIWDISLILIFCKHYNVIRCTI